MEGLERLGRALAALRHARGMRQREVAEALGVRKSSVSRLEAADVNPRIATLRRYLEAIGCTFDDLLRSIRQLEAAAARNPDPEPGEDRRPTAVEHDVAWLLRSHAAIGEELKLLRKEFDRFRSDVSTRALRQAAERQKEGSSSRGRVKDASTESSD